MKIEIKKQLEQIDNLIQQAEGKKAQGLILELHTKGIPTPFLLQAASLAARASLPEISLRLLNPIVRPSSKIIREATDKDKAEYGHALVRIDACSEAKVLLSEINCAKVPEALLYRVLVSLKEWDYTAAVPLLRQYIKSPLISDYSRLVGKVNLALSLILLGGPGLSEVKFLLAEILEESSQRNLNLIHGKAICLLGNFEMRRMNWDAALANFGQAEKLLAELSGIDLYFAKKWKALTQFFLAPKDRQSYEGVLQVRKEALEIKHWESVRDIDFHLAIFKKDEALLTHLYFGTPIPFFQQRILKELPTIPEQYRWELSGDENAEAVDIAEQQKTETGDFLKIGRSMHRLYITLLSDFYRPFNVAVLLEKLFPNEYYRPGVSEFRIHNAIGNLRRWMKDNQLPISISKQKSGYQLSALTPCYIPIRRKERISQIDPRIEHIHERFQGNLFSRADVDALLNLQRTISTALLQTALAEGILEKHGNAKHTRYRFIEKKELAKAS